MSVSLSASAWQDRITVLGTIIRRQTLALAAAPAARLPARLGGMASPGVKPGDRRLHYGLGAAQTADLDILRSNRQ
jgi:hypothetical protein